ncbi:MAG: hypothetical protein JW709_12455 [Sedimentisphaerales bacterium]|nr:hypothetical protein [Sedimentisphaerales bacterium]
MTGKEAIKHRAMMMGVVTGQMPDVELIWQVQREEGNKECFGCGFTCTRTDCRWRSICRALDFYDQARLPIHSVTYTKKASKRRQPRQRVKTFVERAPASARILESAASASSRS